MNYIENYGTIFIPINNIMNSFCFHVAVLQRFHTSRVFNRLISNFHSNNKYIDLMMKPFAEYSKINNQNINQVYENIKNSYSELIDEIIDEDGKHGFSPFILTYIYILPIIYEIFPSDFSKICSEVGIDKTFLNSPAVSINNILESSPFIKPEFRKLQFDLVEKLDHDFVHGKFNINNSNFKSSVLEIYPNKNSFDGGHAIFILKDENKDHLYYVFDDDTTIDLFKNYVNNRNNFIYKICIREIDEDSIQDLQSLWGSKILTRIVNNRWEFINNNHPGEDMKTISNSFISVHESNEKLSGGFEETSDESISEEPIEDKPLEKNIFSFIILFIILVVLIIIVILIITFKKPKLNNFQFIS